MRIETAFLPGAGLGLRLRPWTNDWPKPLLPVGGRPLITYAMEHLQGIGIRRFIVNTHHCPQRYAEVFPDGHWRGTPVMFRHEPVLLDTAGGIKNIEDLLGPEEPLIVYNGDILTDLPLAGLVEGHRLGRCEATLALRSEGPLRNVSLDTQGRVCDLRNTLGNPGARCMQFAGIYLLERPFFRRLKPGAIASVVSVFLDMIREKPGSVAGVVIDGGRWMDVGDRPVYERIRR